MKMTIPRILRKALAACLAALCLAAFLAPAAFAAEPKRTPIALGKTISVSLSTPPVAAHGPTYSFAAPASGVYQLKITDVLLKQTCGFQIQALTPKGVVLDSHYWNYGDWDYDGRKGDAVITFPAKKGAVVILDLLPYMETWDEWGDWKPVEPNTQVASFKMQLSQMQAVTLAQDKATELTLTETAPAILYAFSPAKDGYYSFSSSDGSGDWCDPAAALYDIDGKVLAENDDFWITLSVRGPGGRLEERDSVPAGGLDFNISQPLKAGKTYYLLAKSYSGSACGYTVTAAPSVLAFAKNSMNVGYHKSVWFDDLLAECTYDTLVLNTDFELGWLGSTVDGYTRGTQTINIASPDGKYAQDVTFKVDYDFAQWLAVIFVGGWLWLPRTPVLMPGQTLLDYWRDQIVYSLDNVWWEIQYRLNPMYW